MTYWWEQDTTKKYWWETDTPPAQPVGTVAPSAWPPSRPDSFPTKPKIPDYEKLPPEQHAAALSEYDKQMKVYWQQYGQAQKALRGWERSRFPWEQEIGGQLGRIGRRFIRWERKLTPEQETELQPLREGLEQLRGYSQRDLKEYIRQHFPEYSPERQWILLAEADEALDWDEEQARQKDWHQTWTYFKPDEDMVSSFVAQGETERKAKILARQLSAKAYHAQEGHMRPEEAEGVAEQYFDAKTYQFRTAAEREGLYDPKTGGYDIPGILDKKIASRRYLNELFGVEQVKRALELKKAVGDALGEPGLQVPAHQIRPSLQIPQDVIDALGEPGLQVPEHQVRPFLHIPEEGLELEGGLRVMPDNKVYASDPEKPIGEIDPETGQFIEKEKGWWEKAGNILQWLPPNIGGTLIQKYGLPAIEKVDMPFMVQRQAMDLQTKEERGFDLTGKEKQFMEVFRREAGEPVEENTLLKYLHAPAEQIRQWVHAKRSPSEELKEAYYDSVGIVTRMVHGFATPSTVVSLVAGKFLAPAKIKPKGPSQMWAGPKVSELQKEVVKVKAKQAAGLPVKKPVTALPRPAKVGVKQIVTAETETKIKSLKDTLIKQQYLTEDQYKSVLAQLKFKADKWIDSKQFITEKQGKQLIKAMLNESESGVLMRQNVAAVAVEKSPFIKKIIGSIDAHWAKKYAPIRAGKATVPSKDVGKMHLQSGRYVYQGLEARTGNSFAQINDMLTQQGHANKAFIRGIEHRIKEAAGGSRALRNLKADKTAMQRVSDYINHKNKFDPSVKFPKGITEQEKALARTIEQIFKETAPHYRYQRFTELYAQMAGSSTKISKAMHAPLKSVKHAVSVYESKGPVALQRYLNTQTWGVMESGFDPRFVLNPKLGIQKEKVVFATGRLHGRTVQEYADAVKFLRQDMDVIDRALRYSQQMVNFNMRPYVRAMEDTLRRSIHMFDPKDIHRVENLITQDMLLYLGYQPQTFAGNILQRVVVQPFKTIFGTNLILPFRNLFQNLALAPNKLAFINPLNKKLTAWEKTYLDIHIQQMGGLREVHYLEGAGWKMFDTKILPVNRFIDWMNLYGRSDKVNRLWSFWAHKNHAQRAANAYVKDGNVEKFIKNSGMAQLTPHEQAGILRLLSQKTVRIPGLPTTSGPHAAACEIGGRITDNVHLVYDRVGRAAIEKGELGRALSSLLVYPRSVSERYIMNAYNALKPGATVTPYAKREAWKTLSSMFVGSLVANELFEQVTGRTDQPYRPWSILEWQPGGLVVGSIANLSSLTSDIIKAITGDNAALRRIPTHVSRTGDTFIPFYKMMRTSLESSLGQRYLDRLMVRKVISAIEHALWERGLLTKYAVKGELYEPNEEFYKIERTTKAKILHALFGTEEKTEDYAARMLQNEFTQLGQTYLSDEDSIQTYHLGDYRAELYEWGKELGLGTLRDKEAPLIDEYIKGREMWDDFWDLSDTKKDEMLWEKPELLATLVFWGYNFDIGSNPAAAPLLLEMIERTGVSPESVRALSPDLETLEDPSQPPEDKYRSLQLLAHLVEQFPEMVEWQQRYQETPIGEEREILRREHPLTEAMKYLAGDFVGLQAPLHSAPIILAYMRKNNISPEEVKAFREKPEKYGEMVQLVQKIEALPISVEEADELLELVDAGIDYMDYPMIDAIASWLDMKSTNYGLPETPAAWAEWDDMVQQSGLTYADILGEVGAELIEPIRIYHSEAYYEWDAKKGKYVERADTYKFRREVRKDWPAFDAWGVIKYGWKEPLTEAGEMELLRLMIEYNIPPMDIPAFKADPDKYYVLVNKYAGGT